MQEWLDKNPMMNPPHTRDFLAQDDGNYIMPTNVVENQQVSFNNNTETEDLVALANAVAAEETKDSTLSTRHRKSNQPWLGQVGPHATNNS